VINPTKAILAELAYAGIWSACFSYSCDYRRAAHYFDAVPELEGLIVGDTDTIINRPIDWSFAAAPMGILDRRDDNLTIRCCGWPRGRARTIIRSMFSGWPS
jgi:hypothetical protein